MEKNFQVCFAHLLIVISVISVSKISVIDAVNLFQIDPVDQAELQGAGCPNFNLLPKIDLTAFLGEWTLHCMSKNWIVHSRKAVQGGENLMETESISMSKVPRKNSDTCIRTHFRPMPPGQSYNNAPIWSRTVCPFTQAELNLGCKPSGKTTALSGLWFCTEMTGKMKDADAHFVIVDTDNASWALVVRCFPENGVHWGIYTKTSQLSQAIIDRLMAQIEKLGLETKDHFMFPLQSCFKNEMLDLDFVAYGK